jgi:hypothetical protein
MEATAAPGRHTGAWPRGLALPSNGESAFALLLAGCLGLAALSLLLPSTPTYDPWSWLAWGREIVHLDLHTTAGPSWKPLPGVICALLALAGGAAPALWLVVARFGGLLAAVAVYRLASRLAPRGLGPFAGVAAVVALLVAGLNFKIYGLSIVGGIALGNSEGLLIAFVVLGIEQHLAGRPGRVLACAMGAALLRPEAWPFALLYALFAWTVAPELRRRILVGGAAVVALWFGPELWGSGHLLRSADRAQAITPDNPATTGTPFRTVVSRARSFLAPAVQIGALAGIVLSLVASRRQGRVTPLLGVAALGALWLAIVAGMAQGGVASGNPRYQQLPLALCCVVAGVGLAELAALAGRAVPGRWGTLGAAGVIALAAGASLALRVDRVGRDARALGYEARLNGDLPAAIRAAGGRSRVLGCGTPSTGPLEVSLLAYRLGVHISQVQAAAIVPGTVFQAPPTSSEPPAPAIPADQRLSAVARVGRWRVLAACASAAQSH